MSEPINQEENFENMEKTTFSKKVGDFFWAIKPFLFTHHPDCDTFEQHTFSLFGFKLCIGCYIGMPAFMITVICGILLQLFDFFSTAFLVITGIIFCSSYIFSILGLTEKRYMKILTKILLGMGAGFITGAIFSTNLNEYQAFFLTIIVLEPLFLALSYKRTLGMRKTCKNCEYNNKEEECPGKLHLNSNLNRLGYINRKKDKY